MSACWCASCRSASSQQRDFHIQLLDGPGGDRKCSQFVFEVARETRYIRDTAPRLDADERRPAWLRPDAQIGRIRKVHSQPRPVVGAVGHRTAAQLFENHDVLLEEGIIQDETAPVQRCWLRVWRQQSMVVEAADRRSFFVFELYEVCGTWLTVGQGPAQAGVVAHAGCHWRAPEVAHGAFDGKCGAVQCKTDIQLKLKWIHLQGRLVRAQPERGRGGALRNDLEWPVAGKSVTGKLVSVCANPIGAAGQIANEGEEDGCASWPD